jgi:hypothetical protein
MTKRRRRIENYLFLARRKVGRWFVVDPLDDPSYEMPIERLLNWRWIRPRLGRWLANRASSQPICVICRNDIIDCHRSPEAFLLVEVDAAAERPPKQVWFVEVCDHCGARSNDEILRLGIRQLWGRVVPRRPIEGDAGFVEFVLGAGVFTFDDSHGGDAPMNEEVAGPEPQHGQPPAHNSKHDDEPPEAA